MRDEELARARVSKFDKQSSFQNMFEQRLQQMPGKREKVQITIQADIEHTLGNRIRNREYRKVIWSVQNGSSQIE